MNFAVHLTIFVLDNSKVRPCRQTSVTSGMLQATRPIDCMVVVTNSLSLLFVLEI